jgi:hypothetical protein
MGPLQQAQNKPFDLDIGLDIFNLKPTKKQRLNQALNKDLYSERGEIILFLN